MKENNNLKNTFAYIFFIPVALVGSILATIFFTLISKFAERYAGEWMVENVFPIIQGSVGAGAFTAICLIVAPKNKKPVLYITAVLSVVLAIAVSYQAYLQHALIYGIIYFVSNIAGSAYVFNDLIKNYLKP